MIARSGPCLEARPLGQGPRLAERGFSLVEMMIALTLTLALSAGMLTMLMSTRGNSIAQTGLEQAQDDQRLALAMLANVVHNAAYFPNPQMSTVATELPASGQFSVAGQGLAGSTVAAAPGDTLLVRYEAGSGDGVMDCNGVTNSGGTPLVMVNSFSVDASGNLTCSVNGAAAQTLSGGVQNFKVLYGVDTNGDAASDQYIAASGMSAANWANVYSVRITLTFANPLAGQPGQGSTLAPITQIIPVLNRL